MAWHLAPGGGDLQGNRFFVAGIYGNVALVAYGGGIRCDDQAPFSAVNPGLKLRRGEGDVREAGDEGNVSEFEDWSGCISIPWTFVRWNVRVRRPTAQQDLDGVRHQNGQEEWYRLRL